MSIIDLEKYFKRNIKKQPSSFSGNETEGDTLVQSVGETSGSGSQKDADAVTFHGPNQPKSFPYPKRPFEKQSRSFQENWFKDFPWLHYNEKKDTAFCFICMNQKKKGILMSARNSEKAFITVGFFNWKKALQKFQES